MKYTVEIEENVATITKSTDGTILASLENELKEVTSFIIDTKEDVITDEEDMVFKNLGTLAEQKKGILVIVSKKDLREGIATWEIEKAIWLPTVHEAKEAIFMNDLENQFLAEM